MILTTSTDSHQVTGTISDEAGTVVDTFTIKDGAGIVRRIDSKLSDLMWNRSGFQVIDGQMVAELSRPAAYTLLTTINAR